VKKVIEAFVEERDNALRSLDKDKILMYMKKYGVPNFATTDLAFWAAVHKARVHITTFTKSEIDFSREWLKEHGFNERVV
jgi:hypothetical protein